MYLNKFMGWQRGKVKPVRLRDRWGAGGPTEKRAIKTGILSHRVRPYLAGLLTARPLDPVRLKDVKVAHEILAVTVQLSPSLALIIFFSLRFIL